MFPRATWNCHDNFCEHRRTDNRFPNCQFIFSLFFFFHVSTSSFSDHSLVIIIINDNNNNNYYCWPSVRNRISKLDKYLLHPSWSLRSFKNKICKTERKEVALARSWFSECLSVLINGGRQVEKSKYVLPPWEKCINRGYFWCWGQGGHSLLVGFVGYVSGARDKLHYSRVNAIVSVITGRRCTPRSSMKLLFRGIPHLSLP